MPRGRRFRAGCPNSGHIRGLNVRCAVRTDPRDEYLHQLNESAVNGMKLKSLLWTAIAFIFISVDVSVLGVNLLPDLLGYVILIMSFSALAMRERTFTYPRMLAVPLAGLHAALLLGLVENETLLLILSAVDLLLKLVMAHLVFNALGRLAAAYEQDDLRRPMDSAFIFFTLAAAFPMLSRLVDALEGLCYFASIFLCLYVVNLLVRCYRQILLPVPVEPEPEPALDEDEPEAPEEGAADADSEPQ